MKIIPAYAKASFSFIALMLFGAGGGFVLKFCWAPVTLKSPVCHLP